MEFNTHDQLFLSGATADIVNGSSDPRVIAGLIGACKMLAKIASDPRHIRAVEQAGGLQAVMTTLAGVKGKPEAAAACFAALSPMSQTQSLAQKMMEKDAIALVRCVPNLSYIVNYAIVLSILLVL